MPVTNSRPSKADIRARRPAPRCGRAELTARRKRRPKRSAKANPKNRVAWPRLCVAVGGILRSLASASLLVYVRPGRSSSASVVPAHGHAKPWPCHPASRALRNARGHSPTIAAPFRGLSAAAGIDRAFMPGCQSARPLTRSTTARDRLTALAPSTAPTAYARSSRAAPRGPGGSRPPDRCGGRRGGRRWSRA
jgi:hypothetical protein